MVAAAHAGEAALVVFAAEGRNWLLAVDELAAFRAAIGKTDLETLGMKDEIVFQNAVGSGERLAAEAAAEALAMPLPIGVGKGLGHDLGFTCRASAGWDDRDVPEAARWIARLKRDGRGERQSHSQLLRIRQCLYSQKSIIGSSASPQNMIVEHDSTDTLYRRHQLFQHLLIVRRIRYVGAQCDPHAYGAAESQAKTAGCEPRPRPSQEEK
jgi:hypothetical protein